MIKENTIDIFIKELKYIFGDAFWVIDYNALSLIVLESSIFETITNIQELHRRLVQNRCPFVLKLTDTSPFKKAYLCIESGDVSSEKTKCEEMSVFQNVSIASTITEKSLSSHVQKEKGHFFQVGEYIHTIDPSFGQCRVGPEASKMRLAICTPVFKRLGLLDMWLKYMTLYLIPELESKGYSVTLLIVGDAEEASTVETYALFGNIVFLQHENILGDKKNLLLNLAKSADFDYLAYIDSDDFFSSNTLESLVEKAKENSFWSSVQSCCFLDLKSNKLGVFTGYQKKKSLHGWGLGSGRVFTKKLIRALDEKPFPPLNKSMDYYIRERLVTFNVPVEKRLIPYTTDGSQELFIGVKSDENIWGFDEYSLKPIELNDPQVNWLPTSILQGLERLR